MNLIYIFFSSQVHFASVLNDTEHVQTVKVTNVSPLDVFYTWSFVQHDICFEGKDIDEGLNIFLSSIAIFVFLWQEEHLLGLGKISSLKILLFCKVSEEIYQIVVTKRNMVGV